MARDPAKPAEANRDGDGPTEVQFPRRRLARIVHDDRGNASMEWERLGAHETGPEARQPLKFVDDQVPADRRAPLARVIEPGGGFNPYERLDGAAAPGAPARKPKDLRKLSEWIEQQRQVAARKRENGES
jgi:hypothetical protein